MPLEFESGLSQSFCFYAQLLCLRLATGLNLFDPSALFFFSLAQCFYLTTNLLLFLSSLTRLFFNAFAHDLQLGEPAFLFCRAQPCYFYQAQSLLFGEAAGFLKPLPFFLCALVDLSLE